LKAILKPTKEQVVKTKSAAVRYRLRNTNDCIGLKKKINEIGDDGCSKAMNLVRKDIQFINKTSSKLSTSLTTL
jgi:hypothetical protein